MDPVAILNTLLNSVWGWAILAVAAVAVLPLLTIIMDAITTFISLMFTYIDLQVVDKIPIPPLKAWLEDQMIALLNKEIDTCKKTIDKIKQ